MTRRASPKLSIGLDFGTTSVRALLVNTENGAEIANHVAEYPSGESGVLLDPQDPNLARQNPADYLSCMHEAIARVLEHTDPEGIVGIGVDTTASSPLPVKADGRPLAFDDQFRNDLAAQCWLWKDHTSFAEAAEITALAQTRGEPYLAKCGGTYSSEWFWSKALRCARAAPQIFDAADSWVECCDYVVGVLTGRSEPRVLARSVCAAGHKALYAEEWGGWPSADFLSALDPRLAALRDRMAVKAKTCDQAAGTLTADIADRHGLSRTTQVAVGGIDAHLGAVGAGVRPGVLVKIIGTSTCDCMVHPLGDPLADIPGISGIVRESILPGCYGLEAGQAAVGDLFAWWSRLTGLSQEELTAGAERLTPGQSGLIALDWNNGNRNVLADPLLTGLLVGQTLHTTPSEGYRALIEATAFGALTIVRRLEEHGVQVEEIVNCGGIAERNSLVMQIYADVCDRPMTLARSGQASALGAAIFGAVVGGAHPTVEAAQLAMTGTRPTKFLPNPAAVETYKALYRLYLGLQNGFRVGGDCDGLTHVMKELIRIRDHARRS